MIWKVKIQVVLKSQVLDPQGAAVENALQVLNYHNVQRVRVGKYLELQLQAPDSGAAASQVEEMCQRLLTNPVIEDYTYTLTEVEA